ncbi:hypothetical protein AtubIFM55763_001927 [Aspergillus tubingensis]|uniref:Uncharacterized protein n=1 Tax=Aspergillus tubingensis TaxID=5068 RepID=A0A9W6AV18_ASPTU|nr:hypothetical protein AtubIFM54640_001507 [Aspergillus tubingensis]GLA71487.1 hypothetical protein AtubIFM55763_001927 [Aspergillus tubingensis]GLA87487.1 hypothetical protein AtubIFM56815_001913 [Aspergillus tubingensis]GLA96211.1 hypothetical protein AtubIFM57143_003676 [Aspergillus tubingensis]
MANDEEPTQLAKSFESNFTTPAIFRHFFAVEKDILDCDNSRELGKWYLKWYFEVKLRDDIAETGD